MVRDIIQLGDKRLNQVSKEVIPHEIKSERIQSIIKDTIDTVKAFPEEAAGLSAVQIGELERIFVVKRVDISSDTDRYDVIINPKVIFSSKDKSVEWEGCMSISSENLRLYGPVERSRVVEIEYLDENGDKKVLKGKGFFSHLIQHELDHLNGKLFLAHVKDPNNVWNEEKLDAYLDKYGSLPQFN